MYLTISTIDRRLRRHLVFPVTISDGKTTLKAKAMLDSGASSVFINESFVRKHGIRTQELEYPIMLRNADNSANAIGYITQEASLRFEVNGHVEELSAAVANIGDDEVIVGIDWLRHHNPQIDWTLDEVSFTRCPPKCDNEKRRKRHESRVAHIKATTQSPPLRIAELRDSRPWGPDISDEELEAVPPGYRYSDKYWDVYHDAQEFLVTTDDRFAYKVAASYTHSQAIAEKSAVREGSKTLEQLVPPEFLEFADVFSKSESERLPTRKPYDHAIDLEPGKVPPFTKIYPLAPTERDALKEFVEENLRKGYIRPSKSPAAAPVFFVKKKDGTLRLVVDYRKLNEITVKNRYPLPLTMELVDALQKAKVFTTLDLRWGYHNVRLKEGDEWKAAFRTKEGHFEPTVMTFGLTNAPATFQHMMNDIFKDLIGVYVIIYLDDLLIFSEDESMHDEHVREVLRRLRENDLFCKPEKCKFRQSTVEYLGLLISQGNVSMDPAKVAAVVDWPTPKKLKDVQAFIGFANFYRRFIRDFSHIVRPLTNLAKKDSKWVWGPDQQHAFDELKRQFTTAPILAMPDLDRPFTIECDASDFATGAVLSQKGKDDLLHPVAFLSKSLNDAERNYEIYDKELLAIVRALDEWRHYLEGAAYKLDIVSDHRNLLYFAEARRITRRQARWSLFLSRFNFEIRHKAGKLLGKPDALSRRPDLAPDVDDNVGRVLLTPEMFKLKGMHRGMAKVCGDTALLRKIRKSKAYDEELVEAIESALQRAPTAFKRDLADWGVEDGLLLFQGKVYVPKDKDLRREVVKTYHDSLPAGHPGRWKTYEMVSRNYWWPGLSTFVDGYVTGCDTCARTKNSTKRSIGPLKPNEAPDRPWQAITCDFITQLPVSSGFDAVFVVVDRFTKQAHFIPTTSNVDAAETADMFLRHVWKLHGVPRQVISDRGPQFVSKFLKEVFRRTGIKGSTSTAYHPQTDGQTERVNQELEQYLRAFTDARQSNWADLLPMAEFAHNTHAHSATKQSPFALLYGYDPEFTIAPSPDLSIVPAADRRLEDLRLAQDDAKAALEVAADRMKRYYDRARDEAPTFEVGDRVWLDATNIRMPGARKLLPRRLGPYEIEQVVGELNYRLKLPDSMAIHPVFHVSLLTRHEDDPIVGRRQPPPPPVEVEGDEEYEVEAVVNSRIWRRKLQYLVQWKGYSRSDDTWEDAAALEHAKAKVREFHRKYPAAPRQLNRTTFERLPFQPVRQFTTNPYTDGTISKLSIQTLRRLVIEGG